MFRLIIQNYYLLALIFTCAYVLAFVNFLGRFDTDAPSIKAFRRLLLGGCGWALFDYLVVTSFHNYGADASLLVFRWLCFLFLFYPPACCELMLTLMGRTGSLPRTLVYAPYAFFYLWALALPSQVGGSTFGIPNPAPWGSELWNLAFYYFTVVYVGAFLVWLLLSALRQNDRLRQREMIILCAGGVIAGLGVMGASSLVEGMGPNFPFMGSVSVCFTCVAALLGARLYGRVYSPRVLYQAIIKASPNGMLRLQDGMVVWANQAMANLTGRAEAEQLTGLAMHEILSPRAHQPDELERLAGRVAQGKLDGVELALARPHGRSLWCLASSVPLDHARPELGSLVVFSDLSLRKQAEEERLASEKISAAIETAGGVCHELNQPLQALLTRLELMQMQWAPGDCRHGELEELREMVERISGITRRLIQLTDYRTQDYPGVEKILDLTRSTRS